MRPSHRSKDLGSCGAAKPPLQRLGKSWGRPSHRCKGLGKFWGGQATAAKIPGRVHGLLVPVKDLSDRVAVACWGMGPHGAMHNKNDTDACINELTHVVSRPSTSANCHRQGRWACHHGQRGSIEAQFEHRRQASTCMWTWPLSDGEQPPKHHYKIVV